jgi:SAM-dependent methyltransferase
MLATKVIQHPSSLPPNSAQERNELARIREVYSRRKETVPRHRYSRMSAAHLCSLHECEAAMAIMLHSSGYDSLSGLRILDVGCGRGATLRMLLEYGAEPELLCGIDLLEDFAGQARWLGPKFKILCGSATRLPFPDCSFDLALQFTMFTSVLSDTAKQRIAHEIRRVLVPGGRLLWYDFAYDNPANPDVRGIGRTEIQRLFPEFRIATRRVTLAPPLARTVAPISPVLYYLAAQMRFLCTHYLCLLQKN